ncbi:MAG: TetR/AcrR family transcriptional regulator [Gammaproteobacteria bacterium]|jgi:AcrR family transcriptional regulator|nr:TetR/AcrR family transcriptional regulator [Gammaproteobacteria bacterium]
MTPSKDHLPEEIREKILEAARERFLVYGFNKTTMAEIAKDCEMSAANLYRFFDNKLDIAVTMTCSCLADEESSLSQVIDNFEKSAAEKLRDFIFATLYYNHKRSSETPHLSEMVNAICQGRMDLVEQHMNHKIQILTSLIQAGNDSGEFAVSSPEQTAEAILTATIIFNLPTLTPLFSLETLEKKAAGLTELLLKGLLKK